MVSNLDNVTLGKLKPSDAERLALLANNNKIADSLRDTFPHPYTLADAEWFINFVLNKAKDHRWTIEYKGELAGLIGLHIKDDVYTQNLELGYWLGEQYWNMGIMSEAIRQVLDKGFNELKCHRIYANVFSFNIASMKVLEKNGFKKEGIRRESIYKNGKYWNEHLYGLLLSDLE